MSPGEYLWGLVRDCKSRTTSCHDQIDRIRRVRPQHELFLNQDHRVWNDLGLDDLPSTSSILFKDRAQSISGGICCGIFGRCCRDDQDSCFEYLAHIDFVLRTRGAVYVLTG